MRRGLAIIALMGAVALIFGCTSQIGTPEEIAMQNATVKNFMQQYPNATVQINRYDASAFAGIADEIKKDCQNPNLAAKEYYKVVVNDAASGDYIKAWIDWEGKKLECMYRKGQKVSETTGTKAGEKAAEKCTAGWACKDAMHKAYRNEDCNWEGATFCDYGCGAGRCLASDEQVSGTGAGTEGQQGEQQGGEGGTEDSQQADETPSDLCASMDCPYGCADGACKEAPAEEQVNDANQAQDNQQEQETAQDPNQEQQNQDPCAGISCPDKCEGNLRTHAGHCLEGVCQYAQTMCPNGCENGQCKAAQSGGAKPVGTVFITNAAYTGNLGGVSGADAKCKERATAAGLSGTWKALISDPSVNAKDRIPDTVYKRMDSAVIANSKAGLFSGTITSKIELTELGTKYTLSDKAWTGSTIAGVSSGNNCANWASGASTGKGAMGHGGFIDGKWVAYMNDAACSNNAAIYCVKTSENADPCTGVTCAAKCVGQVRNYNGQCNSTTGTCAYSQENCANGCTNGVCNATADPCANVTCPDKCINDVRDYAGRCVNGACQYSYQPCPFLCANGKCNAPTLGTIFRSSTTYTGNLGGLAGADVKCTDVAKATGLTGTWRAILADSMKGPKDWMPDTPYRRMDGLYIATSKADLLDAILSNPPKISENLQYVGDTTWTGFDANGSLNKINCGNWLSTSGNAYPGHAAYTDKKWANWGVSKACSEKMALYCVKYSEGAGSSPPNQCAGVTCAAKCVGTVKYYNGQCNSTTGACTYSQENCANGCENGACKAAAAPAFPCVNGTCPAICDSNGNKRFNGQCVNGGCNYAVQVCAFGCSNGDCKRSAVGNVFRTSTTHNGNFGGLAALDTYCMEAAKNAGIGGTWRTMAGDSGKNMKDKITIDTVFKNMKGQVIANSKADLLDGGIVAKANYDESGNAVTVADTWTGTSADGTSSGANCGNWMGTASTGTVGSTATASGGWLNSAGKACTTMAGVYCVRIQDVSCAGIACPNKCTGSTLYEKGVCDGGSCRYAPVICAYGCANGACNATAPNPCANVTCPNKCEGSIRKYSGSCNQTNGSCVYASQENCANGCTNGVCNAATDQCAGVTCSTKCVTGTDGVVKRYYNGHCVSGGCQYSNETCTYGCTNSVCNAAPGGSSGATYTCNWTWPQGLKENGILKWTCPSTRAYCKSTTSNCCKHTDAQGYYDCIDCKNGGCTATG